jgi:hypothetical protein
MTLNPRRSIRLTHRDTRTMTRPTLAIFPALAVAALFAAQAGADTSVNMQVHSSLPISCHADIVSSQIVSITPLEITAQVQQSCNTRHDLAVTFSAASVTSPSKLIITLDGTLPSVKLSSAQTFANLAPTDSVKPLVIRYNAGTLAQRQQLAATWGLTITPR